MRILLPVGLVALFVAVVTALGALITGGAGPVARLVLLVSMLVGCISLGIALLDGRNHR